MYVYTYIHIWRNWRSISLSLYIYIYVLCYPTKTQFFCILFCDFRCFVNWRRVPKSTVFGSTIWAFRCRGGYQIWTYRFGKSSCHRVACMCSFNIKTSNVFVSNTIYIKAFGWKNTSRKTKPQKTNPSLTLQALFLGVLGSSKPVLIQDPRCSGQTSRKSWILDPLRSTWKTLGNWERQASSLVRLASLSPQEILGPHSFSRDQLRVCICKYNWQRNSTLESAPQTLEINEFCLECWSLPLGISSSST